MQKSWFLLQGTVFFKNIWFDIFDYTLSNFWNFILGPTIPFRVGVGGALVNLERKLMLINGPMKINLKCNGYECFWTPGYILEYARKYPVAMIVPRSITNCTTSYESLDAEWTQKHLQSPF